MSIDTSENTTLEQEELTENSVSTERFLTFTSDGLTIGASTDYVIEIITNHAITPIPLVPEYVRGIINLRGRIIPIIDIRLRMGKPALEHESTTCIIVLEIDSIYIGIIVDDVQQVLDIDREQISSVPVENQQELINGMISNGDRSVILLLDCNELAHAYAF